MPILPQMEDGICLLSSKKMKDRIRSVLVPSFKDHLLIKYIDTDCHNNNYWAITM